MIDFSDLGNIVANENANKKIARLRAEQAKTTEAIADTERRIRQSENQIKRLQQSLSAQERKARTRRLIERGAIAESFIENAAELTNDEFKTVLAQAFRASRQDHIR